MHKNPKHTLSVFPTTGGAVNPGNDVEIVDELPIEIAASAETGYAFKIGFLWRARALRF